MLNLLMKPFAAAGSAVGAAWDGLWGMLYGFIGGGVLGVGSKLLPRNWVSGIADGIQSVADAAGYAPGVGEWLKGKIGLVSAKLERAADSDSIGHAFGQMGQVGAVTWGFKELVHGFLERFGSHLQPMSHQTRDPKTGQVTTHTSASGVMNNTVVGLGALITGGIIYSLMKNGVGTARPADTTTIAHTPLPPASDTDRPRI